MASTSPAPAYRWPLALNLLLVGGMLLNLVSADPNASVLTLCWMASVAMNLGGVLLMLGLRNWRVAAWFGGCLLLMTGVVAVFFRFVPAPDY